MSEVDAGRRAFLRGRLATRAGREALERSIKPRGPLPPWLGSVAAAGLCLECSGPCAISCPELLVRRHQKEHELAGQPNLVFDAAGCTFCGECAAACPAEPARTGERPPLGIARLDRAACLAWQGITCMSCRDPCLDGALEFPVGARPGIVETACTGCGACVGVCPVRAIRVDLLPPSEA